MTQTNAAGPASLCPISNYLRCAVDRCLREYADAETIGEKDQTLRNAIDLARLIENVILPIARRAGGPCSAVHDYAHHSAGRLLDLARPWIEKHPAMFPRQPDRTLQILDVIEGVERKIAVLEANVQRLAARRRPAKTAERRAA